MDARVRSRAIRRDVWNMTVPHFQRMPRGSFRAATNEVTIDVWKVGGEGWRYTIYCNERGHYLSGEKGFGDVKAACDAAVVGVR